MDVDVNVFCDVCRGSVDESCPREKWLAIATPLERKVCEIGMGAQSPPEGYRHIIVEDVVTSGRLFAHYGVRPLVHKGLHHYWGRVDASVGWVGAIAEFESKVRMVAADNGWTVTQANSSKLQTFVQVKVERNSEIIIWAENVGHKFEISIEPVSAKLPYRAAQISLGDLVTVINEFRSVFYQIEALKIIEGGWPNV